MLNTIQLFANVRGGFLDSNMLSYLGRETRLLSEIQQVDPEFTDTDGVFVFKVYLSYGLDFELGFDSQQKAHQARQDIAVAMTAFWGPDQMLFTNSGNREVTIVSAIDDMTDVFEKEGYAGFSICVTGVPYPVNLVFREPVLARDAHQSICERIETYRREASRDRFRQLNFAVG